MSKFFGRFIALDRIDLAIEPSEFVVLLGRNGAGKTTLLRTLALLQQPSEGELLYDGQPARRSEPALRRRLGFAGHESFLYDELTAEENLLFYARLYGLSEPAARVAEVLAEMDLRDRARSRVRSLSRGLRQRLTLARAWLHQPDVLLLDEPATGLDPAARQRLHGWLAECHAGGRTVMLSTHELTETLESSTRIILLENGRSLVDAPNTPGARAEVAARLATAAEP